MEKGGRPLTTIGKSDTHRSLMVGRLGRSRIGGEQWGEGGGAGEGGGRGFGRVKEATSPGPRLKVKVDYWEKLFNLVPQSIILFLPFELYLNVQQAAHFIFFWKYVFLQRVWIGRDKFTGGKSCISTKYLHFPINIEVGKLSKSTNFKRVLKYVIHLQSQNQILLTTKKYFWARPMRSNVSRPLLCENQTIWEGKKEMMVSLRITWTVTSLWKPKNVEREKKEERLSLRITWTVTDFRSPTLGWQL